MKAPKIIEALNRQIVLLEALSDREIAGFALIVPPEGAVVEILSIESSPDERSFYEMVAKRLISAKEPTGYGGVGVPGMPRR